MKFTENELAAFDGDMYGPRTPKQNEYSKLLSFSFLQSRGYKSEDIPGFTLKEAKEYTDWLAANPVKQPCPSRPKPL